MMLNDADRQAIVAAVEAAESRTSGEIVCVAARRASTYRETPLVYAAAASLLLPPLALLLGWWSPLGLGEKLGGWSAAHAGADAQTALLAVGAYALIQSLIFVAVLGLVAIPPIHRALTPGFVKTRRVRKAAFDQYLATGLPLEDDRTGVVIFAAFEEHRIEIVADALVNGACGEAAWARAVEAMRPALRAGAPGKGFVQAVEICGAALAESFPAEPGNPNRLRDRPVEI